MKKTNLFALTFLFLFCLLRATAAQPSPQWDSWRPLLGAWEAEGKGTPGAGAGKFSFAFDLQEKVIVRKSHTDYPAAQGRPAFVHDDLMVVYADQATNKLRADYFDNEGHVIRYTADFSPDGKTLTLVSDPVPSQPVFRLTYVLQNATAMSVKFEIAPPNAPQQFKTYVEGSARKS